MHADSKTCKTCGETKPLSEYHLHKECRQGVRPECKACWCKHIADRRKADPEHASQLEKARYARDSAKRKAKAKQWYDANWERAREARRDYYVRNPDVFAASRAKRKAAMKGVDHRPYTRGEIYDRDNGICRGCGKHLERNAFEIDHIVPLSLGGPDAPANLQVMCKPCNRSKWTHLEGQIHLPV